MAGLGGPAPGQPRPRPDAPSAAAPAAAAPPAPRELELAIARLLNLGALMSVLLLAVGVALLAAAGRSPLEAEWAPFDLARIPADVLALRPEAFLWLGLVFVLATPASRVIASLVGFASAGERGMAVVSAGILVVIAVGVLVSTQAA